MLSLFRDNDPLKLAFLIFFSVGLRFFVFNQQLSMTTHELSWLIIGERLSNGEILYADLWDNIAPLSGATYTLLHFFFGKSQLSLHIVAFLLFVVQLILLSNMMSRREILNNRNNFPAFVFFLFTHFSFECLSLSPQFMALTVLLPAFKNVLYSDEYSNDFELFKTGFWLGLATLFDVHLTIFILWFLFAMSNFRGMSMRHFSLLIYGFSFPILLLVIFYAQLGEEHFLFQNFFLPYLSSFTRINFENWQFWVFLGLCFVPIFLAAFKILIARSFTSYQASVYLTAIFWLIFVFLMLLFIPKPTTVDFIYLALPAPFLITKWINYIRKLLWAEIAIWFAMACLFAVFYFSHPIYSKNTWAEIESILVKENSFKGKKVLVLGNNINYYYQNEAVTPYFNWQLSKYKWINTNSYENLTELAEVLLKFKPEIIIDEEHQMSLVFSKMPIMKKNYKRTADNQYEIIP